MIKNVSLSDTSNTNVLTSDEDIDFSSKDNITYIIKDEYHSKLANNEDINQQLKQVRLEYHTNFLNNKSIYSTLTDTPLELSEMSTENDDTKKSKNFTEKATLEQRNKIKEALEKFNKKVQENHNKHPRYRIKNVIKPWPKDTVLIAGDSMIHGLEEHRLKKYNVKVRSFPGARIDDMYDYLKPLIKKEPSAIILHIGTNDSTDKTCGQIINEINNLQTYIEENHPTVQIYISSPIVRTDNLNANRTLDEVRTYFKSLSNNIPNCNIDRSCLGSKGLHLNPKGSGRLAINFISLMKSF